MDLAGGDACPFLVNGECLVAKVLRICRGRHGRCVVNLERRCAAKLRTVDGEEIPEWLTCRFYVEGERRGLLGRGRLDAPVRSLRPVDMGAPHVGGRGG